MDNKKEEIRQAYYYTDIEPTLENLHEIIKICEIFIKEGGDRLMCAMDMRKWDLDEIERLAVYIVQSRQKMETELNRLRKYQYDFNDMFATDHNDYYNSHIEEEKKKSPIRKLYNHLINGYFKKHVISKYRKIYCVAQSCYDYAKDYLKINPDQLELLPLGFDAYLIEQKDKAFS